MPQEIIDSLVDIGIALAVAAITTLIAFIVAKIRARLSDKELAVFDEIIKTVETVYRGTSSSDKRAAFEELCKAKRVNVARGVQYLEQHVIPTSKNVNIVTTTPSGGDNDVTD